MFTHNKTWSASSLSDWHCLCLWNTHLSYNWEFTRVSFITLKYKVICLVYLSVYLWWNTERNSVTSVCRILIITRCHEVMLMLVSLYFCCNLQQISEESVCVCVCAKVLCKPWKANTRVFDRGSDLTAACRFAPLMSLRGQICGGPSHRSVATVTHAVTGEFNCCRTASCLLQSRRSRGVGYRMSIQSTQQFVIYFLWAWNHPESPQWSIKLKMLDTNQMLAQQKAQIQIWDPLDYSEITGPPSS